MSSLQRATSLDLSDTIGRLLERGAITEATAKKARQKVEEPAAPREDARPAEGTITDIPERDVREAGERGERRREGIREGLRGMDVGVATMDPVQMLGDIDRRRHAAGVAPSEYEVITEFGGDRPGQMLERDGRQYFVPAYGPVAGDPIEVRPGVSIYELQEFAAGPPGMTPAPGPIPSAPAPQPSAVAGAPPALAPSQPQAMAMPPTFAPSGPAGAAPPAVAAPMVPSGPARPVTPQEALAMAMARRGGGG